MFTELDGNTLEIHLEENEVFLGHEPVPGTTLANHRFRIEPVPTSIGFAVTFTRPYSLIIKVFTPDREQIDQKADGTLIYNHRRDGWRAYNSA